MEDHAMQTILLVDDNADLLDLLTRALDRLGGFTTARAADGLLGLEQAMALQPSCIVIDVLMPNLDGYQLVRALRGDPDTATIPLIILTALAQDKDRYIGLAAGADQYLVKPVTIPDLVKAIYAAIAMNDDARLLQLQELADDPLEGDTI
jgi:CheY-like chemotaxis protein